MKYNFHLYIDNLFFNNVLSDFGYYKSVSLGLSNFGKAKRTCTKITHYSHPLICKEAHSALFQISRWPLPVLSIPLLHDTTFPKLQLF